MSTIAFLPSRKGRGRWYSGDGQGGVGWSDNRSMHRIHFSSCRLKGESKGNVCRLQCLFSGWKSIVRLGSPLALLVMTIREYQVTGVMSGTFSNTPILTSLSKSAFTCSPQCRGTGTTGNRGGFWIHMELEWCSCH